jgi:predicted transcriptional regulator
VLTRRDLELLARKGQAEQQDGRLLAQAIRRQPVICHPDEPLRLVVYRMATTGLTRLPVVERESRRLVGLVSISDLLQARVRTLIEEQRRERVLRIRLLFPFGTRLRALRLREEHLPPPHRESSEEEQTPR